MKRCLILTGGDLDYGFAGEFLKSRSYDRVIAADAGLLAAVRLGLHPDEVVGDLDTVPSETAGLYRKDSSITFEIHRPEKDETDTELALIRAFGEGFSGADILGALGGRADHALANIFQLVCWYKKGFRDIRILDPQNRIRVIGPGKTSFFRADAFGKYISFLPATEYVRGIFLTGFKYPLSDVDVPMGSTLTVSNELVSPEGEITFREGLLFAVESRDAKAAALN